ncbi:GntR family transcriptional regulator [Roseococcus sp. SYP-B2431]|uniref:GntR family transcriptional regulator n=1 Tax=Roseococcus sp. SYP-B2431 TaxID=2496640 RepID=UPI00103DFC3F|nr:GntR family transcriptional regulator [Roseococcus sp. SYP-B2431]TCH96014.1 GntR family transcriptional regulator [Roseococcus sp. SYP-B2431]
MEPRWTLPPRASLAETLAARMVEAMRAGELTPGERIIEATLAARFGVSRGPLREALKALEAEQLVERQPGHSPRVRSVSPDEAAQMVVMRAMLEGLAARLVAARCTPSILAELAAQHQRIRVAALGDRTSEWRDEDWRFHEMVCRHSGNEFLLRSWLSMSNLVRLFLHRHPAFEREGPEGSQAVLLNHDRLLGALASRDPDRAEAAFRDVILESGFSGLGVKPPPGIRA